MSFAIDTPIWINRTAVTVISQVAVRRIGLGTITAFTGHKTPLVVLRFENGQLTGLDMAGHPVSSEDLMAKFAPQVAAFREQAEGSKGSGAP